MSDGAGILELIGRILYSITGPAITL